MAEGERRRLRVLQPPIGTLALVNQRQLTPRPPGFRARRVSHPNLPSSANEGFTWVHVPV
jgi:hypothetical protein